MMKPLVSVVVPCYNQGIYLREAVESVLASSYENIEIIVVDDGSTELETLEVWKGFSMPKTRVIHQENRGPSVARNHAIAEGKGKYILPLDADDKISADLIERSVDVLEENSRVGIVGHQTELFGVEQRVWGPRYRFPEILGRNCLVCSCMFRREDWELVGGYNANMLYGWEDYDFWLSIIELGRDVFQFDEVMFYYRKHGVSRTDECADKAKHEATVKQLIKNHLDLYLAHPEELCALVGEVKMKKRYLRRVRILAACVVLLALALLGVIGAWLFV